MRPIKTIRQAVGDQMRVMVEMHALWTVPAARSITALSEYSPYWVEDPVRADVGGGSPSQRHRRRSRHHARRRRDRPRAGSQTGYLNSAGAERRVSR